MSKKVKSQFMRDMEIWFKYMDVWFKEKEALRKENQIKLKFLNEMIENYKRQVASVKEQIKFNKLSYDQGVKSCKKEKEKIKKAKV